MSVEWLTIAVVVVVVVGGILAVFYPAKMRRDGQSRNDQSGSNPEDGGGTLGGPD